MLCNPSEETGGEQTSMKPLIGVPMDSRPDIDAIFSGGLPDMMIADTPEETIDGIRSGGGIAVGLPLVRSQEEADEMLQYVDALVLPVGDDMAPETANLKINKHSGYFRLYKDQSDVFYALATVKAKKPYLGLCRGMQILNCALGGNMYEHLPDLLPDSKIVHSSPVVPTNYIMHEVNVDKDSTLYRYLGGKERVGVNSFHHMGVDRVGEGLHVVARADDGVVEALENEDGTIVAVQWHPECLFKEHEEMLGIFKGFVAAVAAGKQN